ncbi:hypothetical protein P9112_009676 [Eukaryota sp. TZLM1-RC]
MLSEILSQLESKPHHSYQSSNTSSSIDYESIHVTFTLPLNFSSTLHRDYAKFSSTSRTSHFIRVHIKPLFNILSSIASDLSASSCHDSSTHDHYLDLVKSALSQWFNFLSISFKHLFHPFIDALLSSLPTLLSPLSEDVGITLAKSLTESILSFPFDHSQLLLSLFESIFALFSPFELIIEDFKPNLYCFYHSVLIKYYSKQKLSKIGEIFSDLTCHLSTDNVWDIKRSLDQSEISIPNSVSVFCFKISLISVDFLKLIDQIIKKEIRSFKSTLIKPVVCSFFQELITFVSLFIDLFDNLDIETGALVVKQMSIKVLEGHKELLSLFVKGNFDFFVDFEAPFCLKSLVNQIRKFELMKLFN